MANVITKSVSPTAKIVLYSERSGRHVAEPGGADEGGHRLCRLARVIRDLRDPAGGDEDDHGLPDRAGDGEHVAGDDPRDGGRDDDARRHLELRGAEAIGAVPELSRHGGHGVLGDGGHGRDEHHAHHEARGEDVEDPHPDPEILEQGGEERQGEEAEDDGRDAREHLECRLERIADPRSRVLAQVDGGAEPERQGDDAGPEGHGERADDQRTDAERGRLEERRPALAGEEVDDRDVAERTRSTARAGR